MVAEKSVVIESMLEHARGYGMSETEEGKEDFRRCMNSIPDELFGDFIYTLYRIADKSGSEGFDI